MTPLHYTYTPHPFSVQAASSSSHNSRGCKVEEKSESSSVIRFSIRYLTDTPQKAEDDKKLRSLTTYLNLELQLFETCQAFHISCISSKMLGCWKGSTEVESKKRLFLDNGKQLLEELITLCDGKCSPIRIFSQTELEKVIGDPSRKPFLRDSTYSLYNETYDDRSITVKEYRYNNPQDVKDCIKEIAITSYVNHKNVLKLLGCCLASPCPLQVHEFVSNGSLSNHIYEKSNHPSTRSSLLPWKSRLKIAIEIANAVVYLHTATPRPIIHRNMKLSTILLDHNYVAKLSDFGFATVIPYGETEIRMKVVTKTMRVLPPEYFSTGLVTDKTDVFNFGIILLELLTGKRSSDLVVLPPGPPHVQKSKYLFHGSSKDLKSFIIKDNRLKEIVAPTILEEQEQIEQQWQAFAEVALRCKRKKAWKRPTMMEVAKELRRIQNFCPSIVSDTL